MRRSDTLQSLASPMTAVFAPLSVSFPRLGRVPLVPLKTVYFIPAPTEDAGLVLAALLNSLPVRTYLMTYAERASGAYYRHLAWSVGLLPVPVPVALKLATKHLATQQPTQKDTALLDKLRAASAQLHRVGGGDDALIEQVDVVSAELYGLTPDDVSKLREFVGFLRGGFEPTELELVEPGENEDSGVTE
jgi:hypothetical protein